MYAKTKKLNVIAAAGSRNIIGPKSGRKLESPTIRISAESSGLVRNTAETEPMAAPISARTANLSANCPRSLDDVKPCDL